MKEKKIRKSNIAIAIDNFKVLNKFQRHRINKIEKIKVIIQKKQSTFIKQLMKYNTKIENYVIKEESKQQKKMALFVVNALMRRKYIDLEIIAKHYLHGPEIESYNHKVPKKNYKISLFRETVSQRIPLFPVIHIKNRT